MKPQDALTRVIEHREIFHDEMTSLMRQIMGGEVSPVMIAAIVIGLRVKKEDVYKRQGHFLGKAGAAQGTGLQLGGHLGLHLMRHEALPHRGGGLETLAQPSHWHGHTCQCLQGAAQCSCGRGHDAQVGRLAASPQGGQAGLGHVPNHQRIRHGLRRQVTGVVPLPAGRGVLHGRHLGCVTGPQLDGVSAGMATGVERHGRAPGPRTQKYDFHSRKFI